MRRWVFLVAAALLWSGAARAEKCPNMLILLDRSGSMQGYKWSTATQAIGSFVPPRQTVMRFGLMLFPGFTGDGCGGGELQVGCDFYNGDAVTRALAISGSPGGFTPTSATLDQAAALPEMLDASRKRFVVLLTDGDPTCPDAQDLEGDLVAAERSLQHLLQNGIKTFVIGFGQEVSPSRLDRMAVAGGAARVGATCADPANPSGARIACKYFDASDAASLNAAFDQIASIAQGELKGNSCDDSCYGIGACPSGQRCTQQVQTYAAGKYTLNLGQCVPDPCAGVACGATEFCSEGACTAACTRPCAAGTYCHNGACLADPCASPGGCLCAQTCARYLVCLDGTCQDDPCRYVTCPAAAPYCDRGGCYAGTTSGQPLEPGDGGTGGGQKGGCSAASGGAALALLPLVWAVLRRRRARG